MRITKYCGTLCVFGRPVDVYETNGRTLTAVDGYDTVKLTSAGLEYLIDIAESIWFWRVRERTLVYL